VSVFREIWSLLDRRERRALLLLQIVAVAMGIATLGGIAALMPFLMVVADPQLIARNAALAWLNGHLGFSDARSFTICLGLGFIALMLFGNAVNLFGSLAMSRWAHQIGDRFHAALLDDYLHRDYLFHARNNSATLVTRVIYDVICITNGLLESGLLLMTNAVTIVFVLVSMVWINAFVAVAAALWLGGTYLLFYWFARRRLLQNGLLQGRFAAQRTLTVNESLGAIKEILVCGNQAFFSERFARACHTMSRSTLSNQAMAQSPKYILECITVAGLVAAALFLSGGRGISSWLAQLTFMGFAAYRLLPSLQQTFGAVAKIRSNRAAFDNVAADLRGALRKHEETASPIDPAWRERPRREIRLQNVAFRYGSSRPFEIHDVTLRIPAGAVAGFVGSNGSGKTTLIDIVLGLIDPETGEVQVDTAVIGAANRAAWQARLAYVPQSVFLLDATIEENIALGVPQVQIDRDRLSEAIRLARLDDLVRSLPNGSREQIGERGVRLSGGQRQRLGIARALYRDASVLVLDEATSALDSVVEQEILDTVCALAGRRTIIMAAHRLSAVKRCDVIFEFDAGVLVRSGTYGELIGQSALLRHMLA